MLQRTFAGARVAPPLTIRMSAKKTEKFLNDKIAKLKDAAVYCGATEEESFILADDFHDRICDENFIQFANRFILDADAAEEYVLNDPDNERSVKALDIEPI